MALLHRADWRNDNYVPPGSTCRAWVPQMLTVSAKALTRSTVRRLPAPTAALLTAYVVVRNKQIERIEYMRLSRAGGVHGSLQDRRVSRTSFSDTKIISEPLFYGRPVC